MALTTPKLHAAELCENFALGLAALPAGQKRVDREKKILYGVKMMGLHSPNTYDLDGVQGTDYQQAALTEAIPIYEGLTGYANHPPRLGPGEQKQDRSIYDALGIHRNVRPSDGLASDFHFVPHHPLTESILDAAENENLSGLYAFSHHAYGKGEVRDGRYVITKIERAYSGDIVAKGSTTRTLFESANPTEPRPAMPAAAAPVKTTLGKIVLESRLPPTGKGMSKATLFEMADLMASETDSASEGSHTDDLVAAIGKLVKSSEPADHEMAKKILKMLKPEAKLDESDEPDKDKPKDPDKDKAASAACAMKESREESKQLLTIVGLKAEGPLLEALSHVTGLANKLAMVNELRTLSAAAPKPGLKPPPGAPRPPAGKDLAESAPKFDDLYGASLR